jgi:hypothetical protein
MRPNRDQHRASWLSRDDRQALFVWLFFVLVLALSGLIGGGLADGLQPKRAPPVLGSQTGSDDALYTGSILFVPRDGDHCWQRFLDNQTGRLWDNGFVSCEATAPHSLISQPGRYSAAGRVDAIRKGFLGHGK